ncbi:MAG: hypothetical protein KDB03_11460 [Planctomycetales bacterium]|nr:hypothetical protein [Planctomycetales bacterium]
MKRSASHLRARRLTLEQLQSRQLLAADLLQFARQELTDVYSVDGSGNNLVQEAWGSTGEQLTRLSNADYADGLSAPSGDDRPSAREISNLLADQSGVDIISDRNLSAFIYAWGQFIDHDIGLTPGSPDEIMSIPIPTGDPYFDPNATGSQSIYMFRSLAADGTGETNPRQQLNQITAWIDGSMIYGSDAETANALRTFEGGHLKIDENGMLPLNNEENFPDGTLSLANDAHRVTDGELFAAGDVRANENVELTSLHTLFVREHNRWADQLSRLNPNLNDEQLYQKARTLVIAEIQSITYNEWLPAILGRNGIDRYAGYDSSVNPQLSNEFSTAAFRFGHSMLGDDVEFLDENGHEILEGIPLSDAFFNPTVFDEASIDSIFKYLASDPSSEVDLLVVDSLRNFLFGPPGSGGLDLASMNIQRGRDHGLADFNSVREAVGLPRVTSFADITCNPEVQSKLEQLYGSVDDIDLWVGLLAEDHVQGTSVGETLQRIIGDQFERLRNGDRLWYQQTMSGRLRQQMDRTRLSDIVSRNTGLENLQANVFVFDSSISGTVFGDNNNNDRLDRRETGLAGWTVELVSQPSGETIATAVTDRAGRYQFDVQTGLRTGDYVVRISLDPRGRQVQLESHPVAVTRGDQQLRGIDIAVPRERPMLPPQLPPRQTPGTSNSPRDFALDNAPGNDANLSRAVDVLFGLNDPTRRRQG